MMNQTESVRAFARFLTVQLLPNMDPAAARHMLDNFADKWCEAQGFPKGRYPNELQGEIKPAPMA